MKGLTERVKAVVAGLEGQFTVRDVRAALLAASPKRSLLGESVENVNGVLTAMARRGELNIVGQSPTSRLRILPFQPRPGNVYERSN